MAFPRRVVDLRASLRAEQRTLRQGLVALVLSTAAGFVAGLKGGWDAFRTDPEWKKLSATPGYSDSEIVSNITTVFLRPAAYSQI